MKERKCRHQAVRYNHKKERGKGRERGGRGGCGWREEKGREKRARELLCESELLGVDFLEEVPVRLKGHSWVWYASVDERRKSGNAPERVLLLLRRTFLVATRQRERACSAVIHSLLLNLS